MCALYAIPILRNGEAECSYPSIVARERNVGSNYIVWAEMRGYVSAVRQTVPTPEEAPFKGK